MAVKKEKEESHGLRRREHPVLSSDVSRFLCERESGTAKAIEWPVLATRRTMSNEHAVSRPPEREYDDASSCDFFSYAYLSLAFFLFLCGSGLTFLVLRSDQTLRNPLNRFWMAGPLFICTGLLVALKVLLYVRRKRLIALLIREMTRDQNWSQVGGPRLCSPTDLTLLSRMPPRVRRSSLSDRRCPASSRCRRRTMWLPSHCHPPMTRLSPSRPLKPISLRISRT